MEDAICGGLIVEPQNHPMTIFMGLVSKPGCVVFGGNQRWHVELSWRVHQSEATS